ncbi:MAG: phosphoribosyltransferase [Helicobacteraceae bacterium]|jgi:putative phosphoribosyl transferase|nr:phosphoribosyltransferase [Helicobacteraceae bacterium]
MILFENRADAAQKLLAVMPIQQMKKEKWEVLAMSDQGSQIAFDIAKAIGGSLEYIFTEPICSPINKDCWISVVSETEEIVINHFLANAFDISVDYIYGEAKRKHDEKILSYLYKYRKGAPLRNMAGKNVMLADEGADTGLTLMVSLKTVFAMNPAKVAVALPVIPENLAVELYSLIDDLYLPHRMPHYVEAKSYYQTLENVDAAALINAFSREKSEIKVEKPKGDL